MKEVKFTERDIPEKLKEAMNLLKEDKNYDDVELICNGILNVIPENPVVLGLLGTLYAKKNFTSLAEHMMKLAISRETDKGNLSSLHNNLGFVYKSQRFDAEKAEIEFKKSYNLNPKDAEAVINYGSVFVTSGNPEKALKYIDEGLALDKDHSEGHWNRSLALLESGDYERGFEEYNHHYRSKSKSHRDYGLPEWDGSPGKTVLVYGEQGIGDEIFFTSCLPDLIKISKLVIFDAHPRLCDIIRRSFPEIPVYGTRKCPQLQWLTNHPGIDAQTSVGSLLYHFRKKESDFPGTPHLKADPKLIEHYKNKLEAMGDKPKIGISWKGGTPGTGLKYRKFDLAEYKPIFEALDADYISLQYTENAHLSVQSFEEKNPGFKVHHWQDTIDDYDHTAALVSCLDLVISVPQSVVHLAGALGTPTYQVTPKRILWQSGVYGREKLPWHNSVKLFWQDDDEKWPPVINKVKEELCRLSPTIIEN